MLQNLKLFYSIFQKLVQKLKIVLFLISQFYLKCDENPDVTNPLLEKAAKSLVNLNQTIADLETIFDGYNAIFVDIPVC